MPGGAVRPSVGERSQASCPLRRDPGRRDREPDRANPAPIAPRNTPPPRCLACPSPDRRPCSAMPPFSPPRPRSAACGEGALCGCFGVEVSSPSGRRLGGWILTCLLLLFWFVLFFL